MSANSNSSTALITGGTSGIGQAATADEIAEAIVFLATDRASFIHGVTLPVDGGPTAV